MVAFHFNGVFLIPCCFGTVWPESCTLVRLFVFSLCNTYTNKHKNRSFFRTKIMENVETHWSVINTRHVSQSEARTQQHGQSHDIMLRRKPFLAIRIFLNDLKTMNENISRGQICNDVSGCSQQFFWLHGFYFLFFFSSAVPTIKWPPEKTNKKTMQLWPVLIKQSC